MTTDPATLDPIRQDLQRWQDKLKSDTIEADTYRVLAALIDEAVKLLREMESVLGQARQEREQDSQDRQQRE
jgi:hypothetical protein